LPFSFTQSKQDSFMAQGALSLQYLEWRCFFVLSSDLNKAWISEEMSWAGNVVDIVVGNELGWERVSISGIGLTLIVNDIVVHILIFMDVLVISRVAVSELIGVSTLDALKLDKLISNFHVFLVELNNGTSTWVGKEMSGSSNVIDVVVSVHHFHVSRSITSVGLTHEVDDIIVHVFVLVDVSIIG